MAGRVVTESEEQAYAQRMLTDPAWAIGQIRSMFQELDSGCDDGFWDDEPEQTHLPEDDL